MREWSIPRLAGLRCRAVSERLGDGPPVEQVVGEFCLTGSWAGGSPADGTGIVGGQPLLVCTDASAALGAQPVVTGTNPDVVAGGWFGHLAYSGPSRFAFHDHVLRRRADGWYFEALWSAERDAELRAARDGAARMLATSPAGGWRVGVFGGAERAVHLAAVERAIGEIRAGEIYQVNVCTRLVATFTGNPAAAFAHAATSLRPSYGAFIRGSERALVSLSPELFLRRRGRDVLTAPIKGTALDPTVLRESVKDAAENVMIVDLMRNDLGRVCATGTVRVAALLGIEQHPGIWHLVSRVTGRLRADVDDVELLRATFPPGSVTGAPKVRAVELVDSLESAPRGAYTGAIGFASPSWGTEFSVAIRTFEIADDRIELGVGGGITADSVPMLEWRECLHKAAPLLAGIGSTLDQRLDTPPCPASPDQLRGGLLETLLAVDGVVVRAADHLARLDRSCRELYRSPAPGDLPARIAAAVEGTTGRVAARVCVRPGGESMVTARPASGTTTVRAARTLPRHGGLWRHKWADRTWASSAEAAALDASAAEERGAVPLFVAGDGSVLETSRGNVFLLRDDGTLVTPALRDDLLPGITRRALLDAARDEARDVELRDFDVTEMCSHAAFWTSSLSLAVPIHSVDGRALPRRDDEIVAFTRCLENSSFVS